MAINTSNISLGVGTIEFGNYTNDVFTSYRDIGAIKTEVLIEHNREVLDFESGRPMVVLLQEVIRENVTLTMTLAQVAVATIKDALGQGNIGSGSIPTFLDGTSIAPIGTGISTQTDSVVSGEILKFGGIPTHAYIGLRFTHRKQNGKRIIFEGYKASPMGQLTLPFRETDWNLFTIQFRLLADINKLAGEQYYQMFIEQ